MERHVLPTFALLLATLAVSAAEPEAPDPDRPIGPAWHIPGSAERLAVTVTATVERRNPPIRIPRPFTAPAGLRVVDPANPDDAVPVLLTETEVRLAVPGLCAPNLPRVLFVYRLPPESPLASPLLPGPIPDTDDYASSVLGDAWDFEEGDLEGIRSWGDRPDHYGEVRVANGELTIPVTGPDPYFIWGTMFGDPPKLPDGTEAVERIDSSLYRVLKLRVRQSCADAEWSVFVTDQGGVYRRADFRVEGTDPCDVELDFIDLFGDFADGRIFRALRIDTTDDRPGCTAWVDDVRLCRPAPAVRVGPVLSREAVQRRAAVRTVSVSAPDRVRAGEAFSVRIRLLNRHAREVAGAPAAAVIAGAAGPVTKAFGITGEDGDYAARFIAPERAGIFTISAGTCADDGVPEGEHRRLEVVPGEAVGYTLAPDRRTVPADAPRTTLRIRALDRFGNPMPVSIDRPEWALPGNASVAPGPLRGDPAEVQVGCSPEPGALTAFTLRDPEGRSGSARITTVGLKAGGIRIGPNGYLRDETGAVFLPFGGFYANWPSARPGNNGNVGRALDLFPCNAVPYPHGFPWAPEVEKQVVDFLDLCGENGVTALRLMLRNMDLAGKADPEQMAAVLHLLDLGKARGLRFNVVLFEDYDKPPYVNAEILASIVRPRYTDDELAPLPPHRARFVLDGRVLPQAPDRYTDPDAIACQKDYLVDLLPHLTGRDEIFCYELENEMVHPPMAWVNEMTAFIRDIDPRTPVLGNPGPHAWPEPMRWRGSTPDLYSYHPYNDGTPGADHGAVVFLRSKSSAAAGIPFFTGEGGINQNRWQPDVSDVPAAAAARGVRDHIWLSLCAGAIGAFIWTPMHRGELAEFAAARRALDALGTDFAAFRRKTPRTALALPPRAPEESVYAMVYTLLSRGTDFDVVPSDRTEGYETVLTPRSRAGTLPHTPEDIVPGDGYQAAVLRDAGTGNTLVYLRNVAGGIGDVGTGRSCYLREPRPADALLTLPESAGPIRIAAYNLSTGTLSKPERDGDGDAAVAVIARGTADDFVVWIAPGD